MIQRLCLATLVTLLGACTTPTRAPAGPQLVAPPKFLGELARPLPQAPEPEPDGHEEHGYHQHHVALFTGIGHETRDGHPDHNGLANGLEYTYRFHEQWGIGATAELLGNDTIRNVLLAVPVSFFPTENWRLDVAPGFEFTRSSDSNHFAVRIGTGYEFHLSDHWTLSPEGFVDFIEGGATIYLAGLSIGYGF